MTIKSRSSGRAGVRLLHFSTFAVSQKIGMREEQAAAMSNKQRLIASLADAHGLRDDIPGQAGGLASEEEWVVQIFELKPLLIFVKV